MSFPSKNSFSALQEQEIPSPVQDGKSSPVQSKFAWRQKPEVEAVSVTEAQAEVTDSSFTTVSSGRRAPRQAVQAVTHPASNPRRAAAAGGGGGFRAIQARLAQEADLREQRRLEAEADPKKQEARARNAFLDTQPPEVLDAATREVAFSLLDKLNEDQIRAMLARLGKWIGPDRKPVKVAPSAFANLKECDPASLFRGVPLAYFFQDGRLRKELSERVAQAWSELVAAVKRSDKLKPVHCRVKFNEPAGIVTLDITAFTSEEVKEREARAAAASAAPGAARDSEAAQAVEEERAAPAETKAEDNPWGAAAGGGC